MRRSSWGKLSCGDGAAKVELSEEELSEVGLRMELSEEELELSEEEPGESRAADLKGAV